MRELWIIRINAAPTRTARRTRSSSPASRRPASSSIGRSSRTSPSATRRPSAGSSRRRRAPDARAAPGRRRSLASPRPVRRGRRGFLLPGAAPTAWSPRGASRGPRDDHRPARAAPWRRAVGRRVPRRTRRPSSRSQRRVPRPQGRAHGDPPRHRRRCPSEDRPRVGAVANEVREAVEAASDGAARRPPRGRAARTARGRGRRRHDARPPASRGGRSTRSSRRSTRSRRSSASSASSSYEGPEVEDDVTNFQMLNIPPDHPARDLWDTLYVDIAGPSAPDPHVAGPDPRHAQTRPPIRALLPGRCFRYEAVDASHGFEFFQVEGLMVDEGTSMADLKGLLDEFAHAMFGAGRATRFRPGLLPVHGAVRRVRRRVRRLRRRRAARPAAGRAG